MSAGQEYISATLAVFLEQLSRDEKNRFSFNTVGTQHIYRLAVLQKTIYEILGDSEEVVLAEWEALPQFNAEKTTFLVMME